MNNDLAQFSEERLKKMSVGDDFPTTPEMAALARIALSAKQAKAIGYVESKTTGTDRFIIKGFYAQNINIGDSIYTTPQPAHTELVPDMLGFDPALAGSEATVITNYFTPDGWKLVPIEPTEDMLKAGCRFASEHNTKGSWSKMLAAAPKPESE